MTPTRIVMKGKTLDALATQVRVEHGPRARIVSAERVTSGGIAGLFSRTFVEATVELPERGRRAARPGSQDARAAAAPPPAQRAFEPSPAQRVGLAALLADAEDAEEAFAQEETPPEPVVSTRSGAFADLMDDLAFNGVVPEPVVGAPAPAAATPVPSASASSAAASARIAPALLDGPGDLVVVLGERPDVVALVQTIAEGSTRARAAVRVAGSAADGRHVAVADRRGALEARASGVELDRATLVAVGWDGGAAETVRALAADQIWIAVDAGRKHADTERWLRAASTAIDADGLVVQGSATTSTPETVESLGLPVGWRDA
ncbi:hypothetical protein AS850_01345 [Frondihabitans sp. 762G35]|uniref:hypothetical protein n=1 Tax=Frondihabitans sp. 762G35 TaxID=1446794 RepID=UPI000D20D1A8|nr:hypothetical protein [Frondihabitans sp. 762G35]ARC55720.1 hypothetical protein AS850_01345 [Frondihabitans sp. 762G35]